MKVATENPVITEITADFPNKKEAEKFCETLAVTGDVHNSVSTLGASGRKVSISVDTDKIKDFKKSLTQNTAPILAINSRIEQLQHEIKSLENKSLFTKYWYGYELKKQKMTSLGKLKDRILTDGSKTAGQHVQSIRKEVQHRLLDYGFFSRRTWTMLNTIENEERAVLSPRKS